ncbi:GTP-binding protein, partial [Candidatus Pacearchaeota archaeon]|nr:GTP-binding protein [Candidatus Pacearchaeota archaeon]
MKYKIILAGDGAVGKTSLINRFVTGAFAGDYKATIGVAIASKSLVVKDQEVSLQIWDIAGQTLFREFRKKFYLRAQGALLVFDLTVPKSLDNLHLSWIKDIHQITGEIPSVLIGNK